MFPRPTRFTIRDEHLKLLSRMYVNWQDCEFGAPEVNPKRPYGNSDVIGDLQEILPGRSDDELHRLHRETEAVLQIGVRTGAFALGTYEVGAYSADWKRVEDESRAYECERAKAIIEGERDGSVFVLFMRAQDVRDHFDGDSEVMEILDAATDEEIEALLGGEDFLYGTWHDMCRDVARELRSRLN